MLIKLAQNGWVIRISLEPADLPALGRVVELLEAVLTEEAGTLWSQLILHRNPQRREDIAHETLPALAKVSWEYLGVVRYFLTVCRMQEPAV